MKQLLKKIILSLFMLTLIFCAYQIISKINHKKEVALNIKTIPKFSYTNLKGDLFTNKNLKKDTPTIFIYFNSDCEFCNEEAKMIKGNIDSLNHLQIVFVSFEKLENIKIFALKYQLTTYDNIHFLCDDKVTFTSTFDINTLPTLILYDKNQYLIEKIKGQTKAETLLKKINIE